ncbi:MAG: hypothetical protein Kow0069_29380 [Promethearchaeota archaeon]
MPSFRPALDRELSAWEGYRRGLRPRHQRAFDRLADLARMLGDAGTMANRPFLSEVILMDAAVEHQAALDELRLALRRRGASLELQAGRVDELVAEVARLRREVVRLTEQVARLAGRAAGGNRTTGG